MKKNGRITKVAFVDASLRKACEELEMGKHDEQQLAKFIGRAFDDLRSNPFCGIRIPSKYWPKEYVTKYSINNLWKYDLPDGWRLIYTVRGNELEIISVILEWFDHKNYERRFGY